jgi:hypothetical protein
MAFHHLNKKFIQKDEYTLKDVDEIARSLKNYDNGEELGVLRKVWYEKDALNQRKTDRADLVRLDLNNAAFGLKERMDVYKKSPANTFVSLIFNQY